MACTLVLATAGCGSGGGGAASPTPGYIARAEQLCGGSVLSKGAGEALEVITGADRFEPTNKKTTVAAAAAKLSRASVSTTVARGEICGIFTSADARVDRLRVRWRMEDSGPDGPSASKFTLFPMGDRAGGATDRAFVSFSCHANGVPVAIPDHITVEVENPDVFKEPEGDPQSLKRAYVTVAHSFSLALAKQLRCVDDGDLKATPSL
ncbi:hypothetical protein [Streptomyces sp. NPDC050145]|uniref:hypothetical protein n=1 Tax=Streptomyces sp. NPDC050145 TaxID=3365602 RepID=UPI0037B6A970